MRHIMHKLLNSIDMYKSPTPGVPLPGPIQAASYVAPATAQRVPGTNFTCFSSKETVHLDRGSGDALLPVLNHIIPFPLCQVMFNS